jgi:hypothetical protein
MPSQEVQQAVDFFWRAAGAIEPFPRELEEPAAWGLPVAIVKLPRLWMIDIQCELRHYGVAWTAPADAPLRLSGFMLARRGSGFLFIDGSEPACERRYSLAHEIAHFLVDYHLPRQRAIDMMGPAIRPVLDGERPATLAERVHATLAAVHIGRYEHLVRRDEIYIPSLEDRADAVAVELLAPEEQVWHRVRGWINALSVEEAQPRVRKLLASEFGLPAFAAAGVGDMLIARWWPTPRFREWLGIKTKDSVELPRRRRNTS